MRATIDRIGNGLERMSARDRRALLLGVLALLPAILWVTVIRPYRASITDLRDRAATERALLAREEALVAQRTTLPALAQAARERARQADQRLVRAANPALEEASLTTYLERTASLSRVLLQEARSVQPPRGTDTTGIVRPIRLAVRGESDLKGVLTYIQRIEASPLLLHIAEFSIEPVNDKSPNAQRGAIEFAFVLEAYAASDRGGENDMEEMR